MDHADALRAVGGMCHDDLDACGSQFHLPAGGISQCIGGRAGECQTGWRGSVTESSIYSASYVIFATVFCTVFKYIRFVQVLCTNGGPANGTKNLIYYIYENAIINGRFETACVQAMFLFLLILILTGVQFALEKKTVFYQ